MTLQKSFYLLLFLFVISFWLIAPATEAATCKNIAGKQVCLQHIKRSAKYYWEYRVSLSIDKKKQPERLYNCQFKYFSQLNLPKVYYSEDDYLGNLICRLYQKT